jgi:hypothetical protein
MQAAAAAAEVSRCKRNTDPLHPDVNSRSMSSGSQTRHQSRDAIDKARGRFDGVIGLGVGNGRALIDAIVANFLVAVSLLEKGRKCLIERGVSFASRPNSLRTPE